MSFIARPITFAINRYVLSKYIKAPDQVQALENVSRRVEDLDTSDTSAGLALPVANAATALAKRLDGSLGALLALVDAKATRADGRAHGAHRRAKRNEVMQWLTTL